MSTVSIHLLGRFSAERDQQVICGLESRRVQELFTYLLLHRHRPHAREVLAGTLWEESPGDQARKYLRQALWQLRSALDAPPGSAGGPLLRVEAEWVEIPLSEALWLDVAALERVHAITQGIRGEVLGLASAWIVQEAVDHYEGDLLEGCHLGWCVVERERLARIYLALLEKLMEFYEARHDYEAGLACGRRILGRDRAAERTHQRMMRLYYLSGDRSEALRQYQRCAAALAEELATVPNRRTAALYEQIQADAVEEAAAIPAPEMQGRLHRCVTQLAELQHQVREQKQFVDRLLQCVE